MDGSAAEATPEGPIRSSVVSEEKKQSNNGIVEPVNERRAESNENAEVMLSQEQFRSVVKTAARAKLEPLFGAFFQSHEFTDQEISQIQDTMAATAVGIREIGMEAARKRSQGQKVDAQAMQDKLAEIRLREESTLRDLMGTDLYDEFTEYAKTAQLRVVTNDLAARLYYSDSPLTADLADRVVEVLSSSGQESPINNPRLVDWASVRRELEGDLDETQLEQLNQIIDLYGDAEIKRGIGGG